MLRLLASTRLTVALCIVLAAAGIAGSLLYKGNTAFGENRGFNLFRSPLFLAPAALLSANVVACAARRLAETGLGSPRALTFAALHAGLLLLGAGLLRDGLSASIGTQYFPVGVPHAGYYDWRLGREATLPFAVTAVAARTLYHPRPVQVGIKDARGEKVGVYEGREGVPIRVRPAGITVTPRAVAPDMGSLVFDAAGGGASARGLTATAGGSPPFRGHTVHLVAVWKQPEPSGFEARVRFSPPGGAGTERTIRVNEPARYGGISFCLVDLSQDAYGNAIVGLQLTREPGAPLFWAGALLFGISLLLHLALKFRPGARGGDGGTAAVAAAAALLVLLLAAGPARAAGRSIAGEEVWSGEVRVDAPVTVEKGGTLTIRAGTRVLLSGEDRDRNGCRDGHVLVYGTLRVEGEKERPVRFRRADPAAPWEELFLGDARATIRHAVFEGGTWGLHAHEGDVRVENALFVRNGGGARIRGRGSAFRRCSFRDNGIGLRFWEGGPSVSACAFDGNGTALFYREGTGGGRIGGSRIASREWNLKIGDWAPGALAPAGNSGAGGGGEDRRRLQGEAGARTGDDPSGASRAPGAVRGGPDGGGAMTCRLTRRDFLRAASGAAGLLATGPLAIAGAAPSRPASGAGADAVVALARGTEPGDAVRRAVAAAGGISAFVSRGDVVVLKPNIGWDRTPEQAANTHPEVVAAVAELCLRAGAKSVRVFDRTCNDPRRCYATSGIQAAVEALAKRLGAEDALRVYHAEDRHFVRAALPGATVLKEWPLHRDALEADRIVNVPVAKHHSLARVTAGLKNLMGVMGGNRGQVHYRLPEALVDLNRRLPSALTVVDATRVLVRNGPTGGNLADVQAFGTVFAAAAVVAADAVVAERIFGLSPADVPHIRMALEAGIGATSPSRVRVIEA